MVEADGIDILVDTVGHMSGNRLRMFARKPAPLQVTGWGEPTGTGLATMDYLLADTTLVPASVRGLLTEKVIDLPNFLCYWAPDFVLEADAPPALINGYVTFGSFNRRPKISNEVLSWWAAILRSLPEARLVLKNRIMASPDQQAQVQAFLCEQGISAERITMLAETNHAANFVDYQKLDIALDPFPHAGGMTTLDALWMGVPVITCPGRTISSRLAAASLTALGLTEFIASDRDSYVNLAIRLGSDWKQLSKLRKTLRATITNSTIGNHVAYTRAVEAAYRRIWRHWCERNLS
jgi:predicted O-linked N-acetylglucosamine transferase (SPINDLY family)